MVYINDDGGRKEEMEPKGSMREQRYKLHHDTPKSSTSQNIDVLKSQKRGTLPNGAGSRNHFSNEKTASIPSGLESIHELYSDSVFAKIWGTAQRDLDKVRINYTNTDKTSEWQSKC